MVIPIMLGRDMVTCSLKCCTTIEPSSKNWKSRKKGDANALRQSSSLVTMNVLKCFKMDSILKIKHFYIRMILKLCPDIDNFDNLHFAIEAVDCELHTVDQKMVTSQRSLSSYFRAKVHPLLKYPENGDLFVGWNRWCGGGLNQ